MMANVKKVNDYFDKSPKRMQFFRRILKESLPEVGYTRIKDVCRTRWVERIDGLNRFEDIFGVIVSVLTMIKNNEGDLQEEEGGQYEWNQASRSDADDLIRACSSFGFIVAFIVTRRIFAYTRQATVLLQREEMDIVKAYEMIGLLVETIQDVRQRVDEYHGNWFAAAEEMSASVGGKPSMPRCCNLQRNRANPPASTPQEYYKRSITIPMLDHMLVELTNRFSFRQIDAVKGFSIIPALMMGQRNTNVEAWNDNLKNFLASYEDDLPNAVAIHAEVDIWIKHWARCDRDRLPNTVSKTLLLTDPDVFPVISTMLQILGTLPMTTCTVERSASTLRRIKTWLRSTMTQRRLNSLAIMHVHKEIEINTDAIIDQFERRYPRRMRLSSMRLPEDQTA